MEHPNPHAKIHTDPPVTTAETERRTALTGGAWEGRSVPSANQMSHPDTITVCCEPGCPTLVRGASRCPQHRLPDTRRSRGYSTLAWQAARAKQLRDCPICTGTIEMPSLSQPGHTFPMICGEPATQVDHIDGLGPTGPRGIDPANLRSLCASCHSKRTGRDHKPGSRALRGLT